MHPHCETGADPRVNGHEVRGDEGSPKSYAGVVKARLAHALVPSTTSEKEPRAENLRKRERIEPELVAVVFNLGKYAPIHNTRAIPGEVLPPGLERSCIGFLVSAQVVEAKIDTEKVKREMEYLKKCIIIAYFVGGLQTTKILDTWVAALSREVKSEVWIGRMLGHGFFQIVCKEEAVTQTVLMHLPHLSRWSTCMFQPWIPGFRPSKPVGMRVPV
jgi:hypothetical protein